MKLFLIQHYPTDCLLWILSPVLQDELC